MVPRTIFLLCPPRPRPPAPGPPWLRSSYPIPTSTFDRPRPTIQSQAHLTVSVNSSSLYDRSKDGQVNPGALPAGIVHRPCSSSSVARSVSMSELFHCATDHSGVAQISPPMVQPQAPELRLPHVCTSITTNRARKDGISERARLKDPRLPGITPFI